MSKGQWAKVKESFDRICDRVKKEKISWYRGAKDEGISLGTVYRLKKKYMAGEK